MENNTIMDDQIPPKTPDPLMWIVGDWRQPEFGEAVAWVEARARCLSFDDAGAALARGRAKEPAAAPSAILMVQSRPKQISRGELERLHAAAPLARLVALVGAWCDGVVRSGRAWPGVALVPIDSWQYRLEQELGLNGCNGRFVTPMPRTMAASERLEAKLAALERSSGRAVTAAVVSGRRENFDAVADLIGRLGIEAVWQKESETGGRADDIVVFDGWEHVFAPSSGKDVAGPLRVLLMHFPREEDFERATREGIAAVVAQPVLLTDLAVAIREAMSNAAGPLSCASGL